MAQRPSPNPNGQAFPSFTVEMGNYQEASKVTASTSGAKDPYAIGDCYNGSSMAGDWAISKSE